MTMLLGQDSIRCQILGSLFSLVGYCGSSYLATSGCQLSRRSIGENSYDKRQKLAPIRSFCTPFLGLIEPYDGDQLRLGADKAQPRPRGERRHGGRIGAGP